METLTLITQIAAAVTAISSAALVLIKPIRNKAFGMRDIYSGQKCLLQALRHADDTAVRIGEFHLHVRSVQGYGRELFH